MNANVAPIKPTAPKTVTKAEADAMAEGAPKTPKAPKAVKEPKAPKAPKEKKVSAFQKLYPENAKITMLSGSNPKRVGSKAHATYELYAKSATVGDFLSAGGFYAALSWDVGHGFIKVG